MFDDGPRCPSPAPWRRLYYLEDGKKFTWKKRRPSFH
jgi:hypothetical protein